MMQHLQIALIQSHSHPDPKVNLDRTLAFITEAAARDAKVICTQELFRSEYFCKKENPDHFDLAETIPGPTTLRLQQAAQSLRVILIASLFEKRSAGIFHNSAVLIDADGTLLGTYRKMHIPEDPGFCEKYYFTSGDLGFRVWQTRFAKIGVLICWDQWFPEAARIAALQGAEVLFYPTAIGWLPNEKQSKGTAQLDAWLTIQRSHAIANGCFVAAANRVGKEPGIEFWGNSFVANPFGELIAEAPQSAEKLLITKLNLNQINEARIEWPFFRDRRIDAYEKIHHRFIDRSR